MRQPATILGPLLLLGLLLSTAPLLAADAPTPSHPELRRELLRRREIDQQARREYLRYLQRAKPTDPRADPPSKADLDTFRRTAEKAQAIDRKNTAWLKEVVAEQGWPTRSMVGDDAAGAAWLLVQHADADPAFQRACLDRMTKLLPDEVSPINVAYLTDRVLLAEGKKQRYGTQFYSVDGQQQPRPLEDPDNVDERRAEVGLPPLAEYVELMERNYGKGRPK